MEINNQHKIKSLLIAAGIVEILVGLLHFAMPYFIYQSNGFMNLTNIESDFVLLVIYAVAILLIAFGITTLLLAKKQKELGLLLYYYLIIQIILWTARVILELIYPIKLDMFGVQPFTYIVLPGLIFEWSLFIYAVILLRKIY